MASRLGHPNSSVVQTLIQNKNLPIITNKISFCNDWGFYSSESVANNPLEIVHAGPYPVTSHDRFRYYIVFTDEFSQFSWIFFLTSKAETLTVFHKFKP